MLTLLMLALSNAPIVQSAPVADQAIVRSAPGVNRAAMPCPDPLMQAEQRTGDRAGTLLDRSLDDGQARRYLLLDRRDRNNCHLPISYAIPDQPRALGRVFGPSVSTSTSRPSRPGF
ncbi:hypothetical protein EGY25_05145 [Brevundimonas intermedia]|uniref:Uncharacterized protein n=1 Tax=Brevundimonas intermedia TaxID=74315 RepID=A0A4Y9S3N4_9CAUL|nr:hypothetical protein [Brevundimonas intermedia]TFW14579.1 hypothetical protein EGY25_05145 [Brevundimonas intermedia]